VGTFSTPMYSAASIVPPMITSAKPTLQAPPQFMRWALANRVTRRPAYLVSPHMKTRSQGMKTLSKTIVDVSRWP
jgi:hypothetical protein